MNGKDSNLAALSAAHGLPPRPSLPAGSLSARPCPAPLRRTQPRPPRSSGTPGWDGGHRGARAGAVPVGGSGCRRRMPRGGEGPWGAAWGRRGPRGKSQRRPRAPPARSAGRTPARRLLDGSSGTGTARAPTPPRGKPSGVSEPTVSASQGSR